MKKSFLLLFYYSVLFFPLRAQKINNLQSPDKFIYPLALKPISVLTLTKKPVISMQFAANKLPLFCAMEEKSRSKLGFFVKLRAGNDESYMKMIAPKK